MFDNNAYMKLIDLCIVDEIVLFNENESNSTFYLKK